MFNGIIIGMDDIQLIVVCRCSINTSWFAIVLGIALVVLVLTLLRIVTAKSMFLNAGRVLHNKYRS